LTDAAGNESGQSPALTLTVDTQAPTAPAAPTEYLDNTDPQQGTFGTGTSTNDSTPGVIIPTPGAGETPKLYVDGTEVPATYDPATGTLTPTTPLTEGQYDLTYTLTDEAGNESDPSPAITITVDTQAPAAPAAPTEYLDNTDPQQGTFGTGTSTNDSTPGVIIPAPAAGETPKLYVDGTEVPATYDPATGTLTPTTPLTEGQHDLTYTLTDAAGNESDPSPAITITVDTQAPATPAAPTEYLDNTDPQQGTFGTGTSTNDTTPGLIIPAPAAGETPKLYVDGTEVPATYDPATGTLTPNAPLGEGKHDLTYTLTDAAGNESAQSPALSLTVDTQAPTAPAAPTQYVDDAGTVTGQFGTGTSTDDTTPGLIIAAPGAGETPKLYVDGTEVPATYDPATGTLTP
ncbi:Ig-like domain-containing protein, partial [Acinetobacter gerneri]